MVVPRCFHVALRLAGLLCGPGLVGCGGTVEPEGVEPDLFVPQEVPVGAPGVAYLDPEILSPADRLVFQTLQDGIQRVWIAELDSSDGLFMSANGFDLLVDSGVATLGPRQRTNNGPEWGVDTGGASVFYSKPDARGTAQVWRATDLSPGAVEVTQLTRVTGSHAVNVCVRRDPTRRLRRRVDEGTPADRSEPEPFVGAQGVFVYFIVGGSVSRRGLPTGARPRSRVPWLLLVGCLAGCSSQDSPTGPASAPLVITPAEASLAPGESQAFQARAGGTAVSGVRWRAEGGSNPGTISADGLYTAPATVPSEGLLVRVVAERLDKPGETAEAAVAVTPAPEGDELALSVIVTDSLRARAFYVEALGFSDGGAAAGFPASVLRMFPYRWGGATLKVREYPTSPPAQDGAPTASNGIRFITVPVTGFDSTLARIAARGFAAPTVRTEHGWATSSPRSS